MVALKKIVSGDFQFDTEISTYYDENNIKQNTGSSFCK